MDLFYITGSPCCGKSTVADLLAQRHGTKLYRLDNDLQPFMERLAKSGNQLCKAALAHSMEEMWMREPADMTSDELQIYRDIHPLAQKKIKRYGPDRPVIVEGTGFLPDLLQDQGVSAARCLCMVPTRTFQIGKYRERSWIRYFLSGCSNPDKAFDNWMERDALMAEHMVREAESHGYPVLIVDGRKDVDEVCAEVEQLFLNRDKEA